MIWQNRKPVSVLGTVPTSEDDSDVVEKLPKVNGHWVKQNFARPGLISLYNTYMGGVDVSDFRESALMEGGLFINKTFA